DGSQTRSIQYVDDLVEGCMRLIRSGHAGPVNIGNPHEVAIKDLAIVIRDLVGSDSEIIFVDRPLDDPTVRQPDISLAREILGWTPQVDLEDGLVKTIDWFRGRLGQECRFYQATGRMPRAARREDAGIGHAITVVGAGYVGLTASACLASLGHHVV